MTPNQNYLEAEKLLAPLRKLRLSDTDRALVHLADALRPLLPPPAAAPAATSATIVPSTKVRQDENPS